MAIGETPNLAARLQAAASPGEIVIAASTRRLVGRMFDYRALGAIEVKGLPQPVEAWQVRGEAAGVSRSRPGAPVFCLPSLDGAPDAPLGSGQDRRGSGGAAVGGW